MAPFAVALVIALMLPIILIGINSRTAHIKNYIKLTILFACIVIGSSLTTAFSGRIMMADDDISQNINYLQNFNNDSLNNWPSRIAHLILLTVAMSEIFSWIAGKKKLNDSVFVIWSLAISYWLFSVVICGIFGEIRDYNIKLLYAPIVFTAVALLADETYPKFLNNLRYILFIPLAGSLLLSVLQPSLVLETGYKSLIPGFSIRLAGLTEHANSLGMLAAIALLLETKGSQPSCIRLLFIITSASCLILSQSKTSWGIAVAGLIFYTILHITSTKRSSKSENHLRLFILIIIIILLSSIVALFKFESIINFLHEDRTGLATFTGRTKIWNITMGEFTKNPLFGYGPGLWDPLYRFQKGMLYVGQAHNQYIHTLGQSGILGGISLLIYIITLSKYSLKAPKILYGMPIVFTFALLVRGFSESPMRMMGILDTDGLVHSLAFLGAVASAVINDKKYLVTEGRRT